MFTQVDRPLALRTPLGDDALLLTRVEGEIAISQPFRLTLDLLAPRPAEIPFERVLGQAARVRMRLPGGKDRYFHGVIDRLAQTGSDADFVHYQADLVPPLALLDLTVRSRIYSNRTTPWILASVLSHPLRCAFKWIDESIYAPRAFCVQYEESDLAFAQRLMEDEGIFYFFEHGESEAQLIVTDSARLLRKASEVFPGPDILYFDDSGTAPSPRIRTWAKEQRLRAAKVGVRDFAYQTTAWADRRERKLTPTVAVGQVTHQFNLCPTAEVCAYPGGHAQRFDNVRRDGVTEGRPLPIEAEGERLTWVRSEEEAARGLRLWGTSDAGHLEPGYLFTVKTPRDDHRDGVYYARRVRHRARATGFRSGEEETYHYENDFDALPQALSYRPPRRTPRPRIDGVQTAIVVGLVDKDGPLTREAIEGSQVRIDDLGRVKVLFPWDVDARSEHERSCWLRVAQVWAGNQYGAFFWPRPGHEVVVAFENGDPDRPLIVGSLYNARNRPPCHEQPRGRLNGFKSASLGGNPAAEFNALVFNDSRGNEHLQVRSYRQSVSTRAVRYEFTSGPAREIVGGIPAPVGSGSGGGLFDLLPLFAMLSPNERLDNFLNVFPGKTSQVWGENRSSTLYGRRITRSLGNSDTRVSADLQQIGVEALEKTPYLGALLGLFTRDLGLAGIRGANDMFLGGRGNQTYWGPAVDIKRCQTFTLKDASFFREGIPSATTAVAKSAAVLTVLSSLAVEVLERLFANRDEAGLGLAIGSAAPEIFHAVSLEFEKTLAKFQMADANAYEAHTIVEQWADLKAALTGPTAQMALTAAALPLIVLGLVCTRRTAILSVRF